MTDIIYKIEQNTLGEPAHWKRTLVGAMDLFTQAVFKRPDVTITVVEYNLSSLDRHQLLRLLIGSTSQRLSEFLELLEVDGEQIATSQDSKPALAPD